ncbi:hypothetical protein FRB95_012398 [Tulasnella sp. JGI-2019a]|nr:hypothetical protein FRB95_012398 [Tulasnella sp. JGI-2019a]
MGPLYPSPSNQVHLAQSTSNATTAQSLDNEATKDLFTLLAGSSGEMKPNMKLGIARKSAPSGHGKYRSLLQATKVHCMLVWFQDPMGTGVC